MNFGDYWKGLGPQGQEVFALACESSTFYLYLIAKGHKKPGPKTAIAIERASGSKIKRSELRPDLWPDEKAAA